MARSSNHCHLCSAHSDTSRCEYSSGHALSGFTAGCLGAGRRLQGKSRFAGGSCKSKQAQCVRQVGRWTMRSSWCAASWTASAHCCTRHATRPLLAMTGSVAGHLSFRGVLVVLSPACSLALFPAVRQHEHQAYCLQSNPNSVPAGVCAGRQHRARREHTNRGGDGPLLRLHAHERRVSARYPDVGVRASWALQRQELRALPPDWPCRGAHVARVCCLVPRLPHWWLR
jgi:hypothetical protein